MEDKTTKTSQNKENISSLSNFQPPPTPLLKKIGYGTGVSVYHLDRSPHNHIARSPWALKKINKQHKTEIVYQERLESEAKLLQELHHPNIIGFRGFSKSEDGRKVLAMEECSVSLGDLIEQLNENGRIAFDHKQIVIVIREVAKGLKYLHEDKGFLHGDIKSYNILIKGDFEEVKLCDFGVSLNLKSDCAEDYVGTGCWTAPELLLDGPLTDRADIFSLGIVIWEMLTLQVPSQGFSDSQSFSESFNFSDNYGKAPPVPQGLSSHYDLVIEIFHWCTQPRWDQRPAAQDILNRLVQSGEHLVATPPLITL